jgi:hypothetical protein
MNAKLIFAGLWLMLCLVIFSALAGARISQDRMFNHNGPVNGNDQAKGITFLSIPLDYAINAYRQIATRKDYSGETIGRVGSSITGLAALDSDDDGLSDTLEGTLGTDPNNPDSDNDGLTDYEETRRDAGMATPPTIRRA